MDDNRELGLITTAQSIRSSLSATFNSDYAGATPYKASSSGASPPPTTSAGGGGAAATSCSLSASYSYTYRDYDVYVDSTVADATVTVSDTSGHSDNWHTDSSGYADVYLKTGGKEPGETVKATVGSATCAGTL